MIVFTITWATFLVLSIVTAVLLDAKGYYDNDDWSGNMGGQRHTDQYFCGCVMISFVPVFNIYVVVMNLLRLCGCDKVLSGNNIDNALVKRKEVAVIEERLAKEKKAMKELKGKAKDDIEWILGDLYSPHEFEHQDIEIYKGARFPNTLKEGE